AHPAASSRWLPSFGEGSVDRVPTPDFGDTKMQSFGRKDTASLQLGAMMRLPQPRLSEHRSPSGRGRSVPSCAAPVIVPPPTQVVPGWPSRTPSSASSSSSAPQARLPKTHAYSKQRTWQITTNQQQNNH
ncbi:unnamed protein product, partial [Polarella glacialis]